MTTRSALANRVRSNPFLHMTLTELNEFALEVHAMPNGREKFRLEDLIEMARHGTQEKQESYDAIEAERDDYAEQVRSLEDRLEARKGLAE